MARARKVVQLPPAEAVFILEAMMLDGNVSTETLDRYRARYVSEIHTLEARLARLKDLASPVIPAAAVGAAIAAAVPAVARKVRAARPKIASRIKGLTPERVRSRQLQGRYLGLMRQIPKNLMQQRFGKEAIAAKGKDAVINDMEAYLAENGGVATASSTGRKRRRNRGVKGAASRSAKGGAAKKSRR